MKFKKTLKMAALIAASAALVKIILEDNKNKSFSNDKNEDNQ